MQTRRCNGGRTSGCVSAPSAGTPERWSFFAWVDDAPARSELHTQSYYCASTDTADLRFEGNVLGAALGAGELPDEQGCRSGERGLTAYQPTASLPVIAQRRL